MQVTGKDLLNQLIRRSWSAIACAWFFSFFLSVLQLIVPLHMMQVYDRVMSSRSIDTLVMLTVVAVGGLIVFAALDYIRAKLYMALGEIVARRLSIPTLQAAVAATLGNPPPQGQQAIRDLNDLRMFISGSAITVPFDVAWVPLYLVVLFLLHPVYGLVALGAGAILVVLSLTIELSTRQPLQQANDAAARSISEIGAAVRNAEVIEAMGMLDAVARRWRASQTRALDLLALGNNRSKAIGAAAKAVRLGLQVAMLTAGVILVLDRAASPGSMIAATIIMGRALAPFEQLIEGWRQWIFAYGAFTRIRDLLHSHHATRAPQNLPRPEGRLVVDRVVFIPPGRDRAVLKNISFTLEPGEVLGIVGPSAAGKSTLARLLVGVFEPTTGGVYLDGHNVFQWDRANFGRYVGYLPQNVALLDGTVRDNIARFTDADAVDVVAAARKADVHEMIGRLPFGYESEIGDSQYALSGGQRQRIGLARALFGEPRLVVLDEPNANLDHVGERALLAAIEAAKADGATVILVAHRPSIISVVDKILVIKDGAVDQFGARDEVLKTIAGIANQQTPAEVGGPREAPPSVTRIARIAGGS